MRHQMTKLQPVRTLTVDHCPLVQLGLRVLISPHSDMELVGEAAHFDAVLDNEHQTAPDIVVVGCSIDEPDVPVLSLRRRYPEINILFLLRHDQSGATDILDRAAGIGRITNPFVVVEAIRTLCRGQEAPARASHDLSSRENYVLRELAIGYTNRQIAEHLGVSIKTVETYRLRMSRKLGIRTRADIVRCAITLGMFPPESFSSKSSDEIKTPASEEAKVDKGRKIIEESEIRS